MNSRLKLNYLVKITTNSRLISNKYLGIILDYLKYRKIFDIKVQKDATDMVRRAKKTHYTI